MNIGLFTSVYFNNIGNGFIDLGAEAVLKRAMPVNYELVKISQCANFAASMGKSFILKENLFVNWVWVNLMQKFASKFHDKTYQAISTLDVQSIAKIVDLDFMVIPGCVLTVPFFTIYGKLLEEKSKEGCKLIFMGVSGNFYTDYEVNVVSKYLEKLKPLAIMTRDSIAYNNYKNLAKYTYNGIDNVFFVNLLNIPRVKTNPESYVVVNIEEPKHKHIKNKVIKNLEKRGKNIIFSNHKPFPYSKITKLVKNGELVSDYPLDYLMLYRNADEVYSDRVHACIPTLSFGNKAILFSESPRKALFENVGVKNIDNKPIQVQDLASKQNEQIHFLAKILVDEGIL
ncbi:polysaccharide pyruvyl transferase family protein [Anaerocolumna chitinilytica]|uniref:Polysaccharide pyruvyl transferase domain-containing protein n=1 Tax=Anaerocolumna chitinilytica TaxID=1727145 RepID=A0A7I8DFW3_9FIRM|nr:polysaccharide pyruvyl transferase family protein [Anaerocolumna chitinilytica]BCJ97359.1 hypothetical protein bsdcttw_04000 [Anaerocolumna chitinilytica]